MKRVNLTHRIAIVGCGPAGLAAAIALHDAGHAVTLFERFDEPRPLGSGLMLQPTGLAVMGWLGLREQVESLGQRIDGMLGKTACVEKVVLDIRYTALADDLYGLAIHRASLFHVLFEAVSKRNIQLHTGCDITGIERHSAGVSLTSSAGTSLSSVFDLVVDASGRNSNLLALAQTPPKPVQMDYGALWATVELRGNVVEEQLLEQRYQAASIMAGVLPCGQLPGDNARLATLFWSIKSSDFDRTVSEGIDSLKHSILQIWPEIEPLIEQIHDFDQLTHAEYSHHTLKQPSGPGVVFIGDAAHATSPQLGQGANMALLDARALTAALTSTQAATQAATQGMSKSIDEAVADYARLRRLHVRLFQIASLSLTPLYQSDSTLFPWLRDSLFQPVSKLPFAARIMTSLGAGMMGRPVQKIARYEQATVRGQ